MKFRLNMSGNKKNNLCLFFLFACLLSVRTGLHVVAEVSLRNTLGLGLAPSLYSVFKHCLHWGLVRVMWFGVSPGCEELRHVML